MKLTIKGQIILALCISIAFASCKGKGKSEEKETTTDTTKMTEVTTTNTADMDAAKVAPNLYKVVADTLGIRIMDVNYKPGDSSAMHWHPDYALLTLEGGTATFYGKDGSKMENEMKSGLTMIKLGEFHSVKNSGKTNIHVVLVEVNRTGQATSPDAATDATKVAPEEYKLKNDTLGIRVIEFSYKPGQKSVMHSHPDLALYALSDASAEFTKKDGTKQVMNLKKGMAAVTPADTHSVKNIGKATMKGILVEVYRSMK